MSTAAFTVEPALVAGIPSIIISGQGVTCSIALRGATLLSWISHGDEVIDGYLDADELEDQDGVRSGVLVPFAGRVRDARYEFGRIIHDLLPDETDRTVFHGFVREVDFELESVTHLTGAVRVQFVARTNGIDHPGYPFPLRTQAEYEIREDGVTLDLAVTNLGKTDAPVTLGWHPYFTVPSASSVNELRLVLPASSTLPTDADLLPLHEPRIVAIAGSALDIREPTIIGSAALDACFTDLHRTGSRFETLVSGPGGEQLTVWQTSGEIYVYTGDRLDRDARRCLAIQPISHVPDAFNDSTLHTEIALSGGLTRTFTCGFDYARGGQAQTG